MEQISFTDLAQQKKKAVRKPRLIKNVVTKPFHFTLYFTDGRSEEVTVNAESFHAAVFGLPRFAEVGRYRYELKK